MLVEECEVLLEVKVLVHVPHGRAEAVVVLKDRKIERQKDRKIFLAESRLYTPLTG